MNMTAESGPRLTDEEFFTKCLDLTRPGLAGIAPTLDTGDFAEARRILAADLRRSLKVEAFLSIDRDFTGGSHMMKDETVESACERVMGLGFVSTGTPIEFDDEVDWFANPTFNQYKEWTWQLNRHPEWAWLGRRYLETRDEEYAKTFVRLFQSWVRKTAVEPLDAPSGATKAWRTIETGIRMGGSWQWVLHSFIASPSLTDDVLTDWCKSVWEHGYRLRTVHHSHNWLIMEQNGLAQIGIIYPQFRDASEWRDYAFGTLVEELVNQVYPDGMQYELTTGYHQVNIRNYEWLWDVAEAYDHPVPDAFRSGLERMHEANIKLMMPDGRLPDVNDGSWAEVAPLLERAASLYPERLEFRWAATRGADGTHPEWTSIGLEYSGLFAMRTDWSDEAVYALFDGGPFGYAHQHEDKLNLLIHAYGRLLVTEAGNYAYDSSEMRRYVLSTRGHNTVRIDDMDQNRRLGFSRNMQAAGVHTHSGAVWLTTDGWDLAEALYDEGYGPDAERRASHRRTIVFVKDSARCGLPASLEPLILVVDRLEPYDSANADHSYEILWHFATGEVTVDGDALYSDDVDEPNIALFCARPAGGHLEVVSGRESPEWQGWRSVGTHQQGEYEPTPTAVYSGRFQKPTRVVTVLSPVPAGRRSAIARVTAGTGMDDTVTELVLLDGSRVGLDESSFLAR
ncbi:MAG: alginate lyase family protein [bacterium]